MNTTLSQRLALYERTLLDIESYKVHYALISIRRNGLCFALKMVNTLYFNIDVDPYRMKWSLPELYRYAPESYKNEQQAYWFSEGEWKPRIAILKQVIEDTKQLIASEEYNKSLS
jgi:hypothetical protein